MRENNDNKDNRINLKNGRFCFILSCDDVDFFFFYNCHALHRNALQFSVAINGVEASENRCNCFDIRILT